MDADSLKVVGDRVHPAVPGLVGLGEGLLGDADGVTVAQHDATNYFVVSFPFDRELMGLMDRVPNAVFNKEIKAYVVPLSSAPALEHAVAAMRDVRWNNKVDFDGINALALASGYALQGTEVDEINPPKPQVSDFIEPGRAYRGDVVNVNSRFVAVFSGLGKKDGAAFISIHKLSNLDNDKVLKGDRVGIVYESLSNGAVTVLSKIKTSAELSVDFAFNYGEKVDGVTVSDYGGKIVVAFDINAAMVNRIRKVEGAVFNKDGKAWEIPKDRKEFALIAVQDLRHEFVADAKEVASLTALAQSKVDGAKVFPAFTKDGHEAYGVVLAVTERYALQSGGRGNFTLHPLAGLDQVPHLNHEVEIKYNKGVGAVFDNTVARMQGQDQGRGR